MIISKTGCRINVYYHLAHKYLLIVMTDIGWGWLAEFEQFGRLGDHKNDFKTITYVEAKTTYASFTHASHGMIYAKDDRMLWNLYNAKAAVLMQLRFDGVFGFPGGLVEAGEDPVVGMNREMEEEIGLDLEKHSFSDTDHIASFINVQKSLVLHFFLKEVTLEEFCVLEKNNLQAPEYGTETYGVVRVPLFTMGDGIRGFPAFLANHFAGNAREELLMALTHSGILTAEEIQTALVAAQQFITNVMPQNS